jgi:hypothetical protein
LEQGNRQRRSCWLGLPKEEGCCCMCSVASFCDQFQVEHSTTATISRVKHLCSQTTPVCRNRPTWRPNSAAMSSSVIGNVVGGIRHIPHTSAGYKSLTSQWATSHSEGGYPKHITSEKCVGHTLSASKWWPILVCQDLSYLIITTNQSSAKKRGRI